MNSFNKCRSILAMKEKAEDAYMRYRLTPVSKLATTMQKHPCVIRDCFPALDIAVYGWLNKRTNKLLLMGLQGHKHIHLRGISKKLSSQADIEGSIAEGKRVLALYLKDAIAGLVAEDVLKEVARKMGGAYRDREHKRDNGRVAPNELPPWLREDGQEDMQPMQQFPVPPPPPGVLL